MAIETDTERTTMLADFGEVFALADESEVTCIFYDPYAEALDVEGNRPSILGLTSDLGSLSQGDQVTRQADFTIYQVSNSQPDGQGFTLLRLEEQS